MRFSVALAGVLAALVLAPAAQAFTATKFKVKDQGSRIHYWTTRP